MLILNGILPNARFVVTPGIEALVATNPGQVQTFVDNALAQLGAYDQQPSMVFGDPKVTKAHLDDLTPMDDGTEKHLSAVIPCQPQKMWLKRDDYPDGQPVYTLLLPSEY
jgi:hypothetical protein